MTYEEWIGAWEVENWLLDSQREKIIATEAWNAGRAGGYTAGYAAAKEQAAGVVCAFCAAGELPNANQRGAPAHLSNGRIVFCLAAAIRAMEPEGGEG